MAVRYAVNNGNWSDVATWDGGASLPTVGDDVYANGYTITVDQNIEVDKISTEVCPTTSVGGGRFSANAARNIIANVYAGTSYCLYITQGSIVIGNVYGGKFYFCLWYITSKLW